MVLGWGITPQKTDQLRHPEEDGDGDGDGDGDLWGDKQAKSRDICPDVPVLCLFALTDLPGRGHNISGKARFPGPFREGSRAPLRHFVKPKAS